MEKEATCTTDPKLTDPTGASTSSGQVQSLVQVTLKQAWLETGAGIITKDKTWKACTLSNGDIEGKPSSGWPWFFHCLEESIAKSDITALHQSTTLEAMVDAIYGMPFRFKWLVARELRKVSTNIKRDGEVDITINPGGKKFFPNLGINVGQRDALGSRVL